MISEAMMGASALKTAFDMAKGLKDISDATIRNAAVIELQEKILSAQEAQFARVKRVDELEKRNGGTQNKEHPAAALPTEGLRREYVRLRIKRIRSSRRTKSSCLHHLLPARAYQHSPVRI
jgi:hypothetical protein